MPQFHLKDPFTPPRLLPSPSFVTEKRSGVRDVVHERQDDLGSAFGGAVALRFGSEKETECEDGGRGRAGVHWISVAADMVSKVRW